MIVYLLCVCTKTADNIALRRQLFPHLNIEKLAVLLEKVSVPSHSCKHVFKHLNILTHLLENSVDDSVLHCGLLQQLSSFGEIPDARTGKKIQSAAQESVGKLVLLLLQNHNNLFF